jgi:hypothetical protein
MLQCRNQFIPLQTIKTSVKLNEEYKVEDILENGWLVKKPTTSSSEKNMIPLRTHENHNKTSRTVWGHLTFWERKIESQKNETLSWQSVTMSEDHFHSLFHHYHYQVQQQTVSLLQSTTVCLIKSSASIQSWRQVRQVQRLQCLFLFKAEGKFCWETLTKWLHMNDHVEYIYCI